jgi:hypothetical protein
MKNLTSFTFIFILAFLQACQPDNTTVPSENTIQETVSSEEETANDFLLQPLEAPTNCDMELTAEDMLQAYQNEDVSGLDGIAVCFEGYVFNEHSYDVLYQADIAFAPFDENAEDVPVIYCQFTGANGEKIKETKKGDKISVIGIMRPIDNPDKQNAMMVKCSIREN